MNNRNRELLKFVVWMTAMVILSVVLGMLNRAQADSPPPTAKVTNEYRFETYDAAARAALQESVKLSKTYEYAGVVLQCGDLYAYTDPVTNNSKSKVHYHLEYTTNCHVVALYHTHPGGSDDANVASNADKALAMRFGVPSYIMVVKTKRVFICNKEAMKPGLQL